MSKLPTAPKGWRECTSKEYTSAYIANRKRGLFQNDGGEAKYFIPIEPITASGVLEYDSIGSPRLSTAKTCGLTYKRVAGKKFRVTMEEVME